jgi:Pyruvate/2-oxoacid:ferredoxin oxidoreductase delta subunit
MNRSQALQILSIIKTIRNYGQEKEKITRDAFLYLDPKEPKNQFAQCGQCMMYTGKSKENVATCTIIGPDEPIRGDIDSCGLFVHGAPVPDERGYEMESVSKKEAGYVERLVRCENCISYEPEKSICLLFKSLNKSMPEQFDLNINVDQQGCCNAQRPLST